MGWQDSLRNHYRASALSRRTGPLTLDDLRLVRSRADIPTLLTRMRASTICEVGVRDGEHFRALLVPCVKSAVAIDPWKETGLRSQNDDSRAERELEAQYQNACALAKADRRVQVVRAFSPTASEQFADGHFDLVYIDADHTEAAVYADLTAWWPKVRPGGVLSGHDYCRVTLPNRVQFGVVEAVDRFVAEHSLRLTVVNDGAWPSWLLLKQI